MSTPKPSAPREFDIETIRHRIKRLHELGPNHEHFKLGDMDCEQLLAAYEALEKERDEARAEHSEAVTWYLKERVRAARLIEEIRALGATPIAWAPSDLQTWANKVIRAYESEGK